MTIFGLPLHVLMVHAVVVLVPLAAVGGVAISALRWARRRYASLVVVGAFAAAVSSFVAQQAGEDFQRSFSRPTATMLRHFALGDGLTLWVVGLFVGTAAVLLAQWLADRQDSRARPVLIAGVVVTVVCAVVSVIQVIRIGHSGAVAVWGGMTG
jgi:H+/Cl- antiporter ClcA